MHQSGDLDEYHLLAEAIPQINWVATSDGLVEYFNSLWYSYTGRSVERSIGDQWVDVIHPEDRLETLRKRRNAFANGERFEGECRVLGADGIYRWFRVRVVPIIGRDGKIKRWFGSCTDFEDQRRAESLLVFFARSGRALTASLEPRDLAENFLRLLVPEFADFAVICARDDAELHRLAMRHVDPMGMRVLAELDRQYPLAESDALVRLAFEQRESVILDSVSSDIRAARARSPEHFLLMERLGTCSTMVVPLITRDHIVGVLLMGYVDIERSYSDADRPIVQEMAYRLATAIDNARRYQHERAVASALQEAILPARLPSIPYARLSGFYVPAASELRVGGDWYDAFVLPNGLVGLSVGDVTGHGLDAAIVMGEIRQAIRSAAIEAHAPSIVLDHADRVLSMNHPDAIATAGYGLFDPIERRLEYATAGHPPPFIADANGSVTLLEAQGLPLGMRAFTASTAATTQLAASSLVCFYTDGLIEFQRDALAGEEALRIALSRESAEPARDIAERVYRSVVVDRTHEDDTAILVLHIE